MKISIVTVCLNNDSGLKKTIESIRKQSYCDKEFIIIDGGSTDGSIDTIKENIDIIDIWISEPDSGIYNAMNKSLNKCHGEYVIFMNAGDYFYDDNVLTDVFKQEPKSDVVYGDVKFDKIQYANKEIKTLQDFFCKSPFCHQGVFTKVEIAKKYGFDETYRIVSDWIMFTKIFMDGGTFEYIPNIIAKCALGGVSSDFKKNNEERIHYLEKTYSKRVTEDYLELMKLKNGILFDYYLKLENSKKLKYYLYSLLKLLRIKY